MIFWELFVSHLKIGFFGFGGGYAMLSLIQNEVVVQHAWMTNAELPTSWPYRRSRPAPSPSIRRLTWVTQLECKAAAWYGILARSLRLSRSACRR